jgi:Rv2525c-like, glycoside hydrolase-like domain
MEEGQMSQPKGIDYSFYAHPSVSAIRAGGYKFVGRYVSPDPGNDGNGKNLLQGESTALRSAGLSLILYAESYAGRMRSGMAAGKEDARHFDSVAKALGMPTAVMYACADFDATPGDQAAINAYLDGVAAILGRARTGLYGGYWSVSRAFAAGKISYAVQTIAWSGGIWDARADVRQGLYVTVGGSQCDILTAMHTPDFGQWPRPAVPANTAMNPVKGMVVATRYTQADVSWHSDPKATGYRIIVRRQPSGDEVFRYNQVGTSITVHNLLRGTQYSVGVLAIPASTGPETIRAVVTFTTRR